jgi:hypothetical protein
MANPFDDLIPADGSKPLVITITPNGGRGAFDDLIPQHEGARMVGQFAQNFNDQVATAAGLPVDLTTGAINLGIRGVNALGANLSQIQNPIGGSESIKHGLDYIASIPGKLGLTTENAPVRFEPETRAEKIAAGVGTGAGALATTLLPAGVLAKAAPAGSLTERVASALSSQPAMQTASAVAGGAASGATDNPYVGLGASLAVPLGASAVRGAISPVTNALNANEQNLVKLAGQEGIPLTPSQTTGSGVLRGLEETMAKLPLSSGPMQNTYAGQREALNKAILSRTGSTATEASPSTLDTIYSDLGQKFDNLASRTTVKPDQQFMADVLGTAQNYGRRLSTDQAPVFQSYLDDLKPLLGAIQSGQNPQIAGDVYKTIRSDLVKRVRTTNDLQLKDALGGLVEAFDGAMERSATGPLAQEWQEARRQYAALKTVDKAMQGGTQADRSQANIPLGAFANAVKAGDREGYARARGQYGDLAKLADYLAPRIPDSGTATRGFMTSLLTGGSIAGPIAGAGGFTLPAIAAAVAGAATPYAASRLYNTGLASRYLTNQAAGSTRFAPLLAAEGERQAVENQDRRMKSLANLLMQANEKRMQ